MANGLDAELSPETREALLQSGRPRHFREGEVVFHQGDPCDSLFLLRSGRVAAQVITPDGDQATLGLMTAPEEFGEIGLLRSDHHHTATVVALEEVRVLAIAAEQFRLLRLEHPDLTEWLLGALARRLERTSRLLAEALFVDADHRVARRLLECHIAYDAGPNAILPLRQDDLAAMAGVSRPTANRALRRLAQSGAVRLGRRRIEILDLSELNRAAR